MPSREVEEIVFNLSPYSAEELLEIYRQMLLPRLIEEKMLVLLRQGKISKWFSGYGQEAISVGAGMALAPDEFIFPLHRNLGIFTVRQVPLGRLFSQWQGKAEGFTRGRDRSFHFGTKHHHIVGMISHLGAQLSLAIGVALASRLKGEKKVTLAFTGDGGTSEGEFHEALNVAAVWDLPVIFLIENNGYGLSTPVSEQFRCEQLADRGKGYGMRSLTIDGNNILEVYETIRMLAEQIREKPEPILLECMTFRRRGHEEASGTRYVPESLMAYWEARDPLHNFEQRLLEAGILDENRIQNFQRQHKEKIQAALEIAFSAPPPQPDVRMELEDVYAPSFAHHPPAPDAGVREMRFVDALSDGLRESLIRHPELVFMGQDIAEYGGVFKITAGFLESFGKDRIRNTPLCESAIVGAGLGLSLKGFKSMVEMQFADFVSCGFNQIVNNLAKLHYRWGEKADVVIRMPTGAGVGAGPFHSQSNEAWFAHVPGLKVLYPATPHDAKGLLLAAFEDPNPVLFFEHKALYRSLSGPVPEGYYSEPIGKARLAREGDQVSVITYGMGVHWAESATQKMGVEADILDLRTLLPLDTEAIRNTVQKTGKVIILHEDTLFGGFGGELAAFIAEHLFEYLDGPVMRVGSLDTPVPFAKELEKQFLPEKRFAEALEKLLAY